MGQFCTFRTIPSATFSCKNGNCQYLYGYKDGYRWSSSSAAEASYATGRITGWIPFTSGSTYYIKNFNMSRSGYVTNGYVLLKKTDGTIQTVAAANSMFGTFSKTYNATTDTWAMTCTNADVVSFRISAYSTTLMPIITCNEPI
jgi:hypothetical protein